MNKKILVSTLLFVCILSILGCQHQKESETIKIGFVGPFSGPAAKFGQFMDNGLEIALDELSQEEKDKIQIIKEDDGGDGKKAVDAVQKMVEINNIQYIIGPLNNASVLATEKQFDNNQVISLIAGLPNEQIANMGDYHFSFLPEIGLLKKYLADYIKNQRGINKVAIIYHQDAFGEELKNKFSAYYQSYGEQIVAEQSFKKGSGDVKTQLTKIKEQNPEAIFITAYGNDLIVILRQLEEMGLKNLPKFGSHSFETPDILEQVSELAEGVVYPYPTATNKNKPQSVDDFIAKYQNKYGSYPDPYSANAYDNFNLLYQSIKECGHNNNECVREKLANVENYEGANGILTVDERGVAIFDEARLRTVKNGKFVNLEQ